MKLKSTSGGGTRQGKELRNFKKKQLRRKRKML
jgi:hypothetical protein